MWYSFHKNKWKGQRRRCNGVLRDPDAAAVCSGTQSLAMILRYRWTRMISMCPLSEQNMILFTLEKFSPLQWMWNPDMPLCQQHKFLPILVVAVESITLTAELLVLGRRDGHVRIHKWCNISRKKSGTAPAFSPCVDAGSNHAMLQICSISSVVPAKPSSSPMDQIIPETERWCWRLFSRLE